MKTINRRTFVKLSGVLGSAAALPRASAGDPAPAGYDDAQAKLYDATKCIGCRACLRACRTAHNLPPHTGRINGQPYDMPGELSPNDLMVIQVYREETAVPEGSAPRWSFMKRNCMHCNVPACASACPVAALHKSADGAVEYDESRCIGCRYCLLACPYQVPRYEWVDRMPRVRKCDFSLACLKACPTGALKSGTRKELIAEAHQRIARHPERYVDHVYGEHEAGGASYLILSGIPFEVFGLPKLSSTVRSTYADSMVSALPGWIIAMGLFLGGLYEMERRQERAAEPQKQDKQGGGP